MCNLCLQSKKSQRFKMEMCLLACLVAPFCQCVEYSVFDFLHLGFPAWFAWEPPAAVYAAAPHSVHVALKLPFKEACAVVPTVARTVSPLTPYSRLHLAIEAPVLKSI